MTQEDGGQHVTHQSEESSLLDFGGAFAAQCPVVKKIALISCLFVSVFAACTWAAADIDVLSWMWYKGDYDTYYVVGEVQNVGDRSAEYVMIVATLYDAADEVVDTDYTFTYLDLIGPGERSPFKCALWDLPATPQRCRIQWEWRESSQLPQRLVTVSSIRGYYDSDYDAFKVVGEVGNGSGFAVEFVQIIVTCYDEDGEIVSCDYTFSTLDSIQAGGTSPFDTWISDFASRVKKFRYIVQYRRK